MEHPLDLTATDALQGNWNYPTTIRMGSGRLNEIAFVCKSLGIRKPLLVTDAGLAKMAFVEQALVLIKAEGMSVTLFCNVKPNPTGENVRQGVKVYQQGGHDGVIALGGGSGLDAGKAIALMSGQTHSMWDFENVGSNWLRADPAGIAPIVAIPTTSGTGAEVSRASSILDEDAQVKKVIFHPSLMPKVVLADPDLVTSLPADLTAATGLSAFVHCLDAYCAPGYHPMADGIALEGMRLIKTWLPEAVSNGHKLIARSHMMVASLMGATAFQKGLGGAHALVQPLSALYDAHHGLLHAILLPYVLMRNRHAIEGRVSHIAICIGLDDTSFDGFISWVLSVRKELNIPNTLADIGISTDGSEKIAKMAFEAASVSGNPAALSTGDYALLFCNAVNGNETR